MNHVMGQESGECAQLKDHKYFWMQGPRRISLTYSMNLIYSCTVIYMISSMNTFKASSNCCRVGQCRKFLTDDVKAVTRIHDFNDLMRLLFIFSPLPLCQCHLQLNYSFACSALSLISYTILSSMLLFCVRPPPCHAHGTDCDCSRWCPGFHLLCHTILPHIFSVCRLSLKYTFV